MSRALDSSVKSAISSRGNPNSYTHFTTGHEDLVHDVAYDYYGRRMATVSSDQRLKIFDLNADNEWVLSESFKAHDASINKVIWGPPEYGQILATCSHDRNVRIWEEQQQTEPPPAAEGRVSTPRWKRQFQMTADARTAIHTIAFPPAPASPSAASAASTSAASSGLKLAFISTDGIIHLYECREPQDLTHWVVADQVSVFPSPPPPREVEVALALAFCPSRVADMQMVVAAMDTVRIYRRNAAGKIRPAEELPGHRALVRDVAWAVSMGRSYQLIATACKDGHVRIFKLTRKQPVGGTGSSGGGMVAAPPPAPRRRKAGLSQGLGSEDEDGVLVGGAGAGQGQGGEEGGDGGWVVEKVADFGDHKSEVWRVAWNATGTILSSTGDDGKIRLWKAAIHGEFQLLSVIATPRSSGREEAIVEDD